MPFQFHFGTIDRNEKTMNTMDIINFNSTLVRLIELSVQAVERAIIFQFHFGTIDRFLRGEMKPVAV